MKETKPYPKDPAPIRDSPGVRPVHQFQVPGVASGTAVGAGVAVELGVGSTVGVVPDAAARSTVTGAAVAGIVSSPPHAARAITTTSKMRTDAAPFRRSGAVAASRAAFFLSFAGRLSVRSGSGLRSDATPGMPVEIHGRAFDSILKPAFGVESRDP